MDILGIKFLELVILGMLGIIMVDASKNRLVIKFQTLRRKK